MNRKKFKILGSFFALGVFLGLGCKCFAYSSSNGLNSTEQTQWNNLYTSFNTEYNNTGVVKYYSFSSQELESMPYQNLFDTNGQLKNGYNGLQIGWRHSGNASTVLYGQINIQHYYLLLYNNSNSIITASKCSIGAYNYLSISSPLGNALEFDGDFSEYDDYIKIGANSLTLYEITFNPTLQYFCSRYGSSWYSGQNGFDIDGGLSLSIQFTGNITSLTAYLYDDETLRTYLGYANEYVNAQSSGYSRGYSEGQTVGYNTGYSEGQTVGYDSGYEVGSRVGYNQGVASVDTSSSVINSILISVPDSAITILNGLFAPTIFNVPILSILLSLLGILLIFMLIKKFLK